MNMSLLRSFITPCAIVYYYDFAPTGAIELISNFDVVILYELLLLGTIDS